MRRQMKKASQRLVGDEGVGGWGVNPALYGMLYETLILHNNSRNVNAIKMKRKMSWKFTCGPYKSRIYAVDPNLLS